MLTSRQLIFSFIFSIFAWNLACAQDDQEWEQYRAQFEASLHRQTGTIQLPGNIASIKLSKDYNYLSPQDAEHVLVDAWGNPPGELSLGMIIPARYSVLDDAGWAVVIEYSEDGHVSDEDAHTIDYDELLADLQSEEADENEARAEAGYGSVHLVGWAAAPYYDSSAHKLHWAKELAFAGNEENTLNYNVRILGRNGYLILNAVGNMSQFEQVNRDMGKVLAFTNFNSGYAYEDFDPQYDKVAAYGIGAIVAGKLAAKAGLFAKLGVLLLAFKKFLIFIFVGIAAVFTKVVQKLRGRSAG